MIKNLQDILRELKKTYTYTALASLTESNAFKVLISTVLSHRTRDEKTLLASNKLFAKFDTPKKLANAKISEIKPLIKQTGFYNEKSKRIKQISQLLIKNHAGKVPEDLETMIQLPGVGRKTANCVLVYAFRKPAIPVDSHVHQIANRLGWVKTDTPEKTEMKLMQIIPKRYWILINDLFVSHGKEICVPISPKCSKCPIKKYCKRINVKRSR